MIKQTKLVRALREEQKYKDLAVNKLIASFNLGFQYKDDEYEIAIENFKNKLHLNSTIKAGSGILVSHRSDCGTYHITDDINNWSAVGMEGRKIHKEYVGE